MARHVRVYAVSVCKHAPYVNVCVVCFGLYARACTHVHVRENVHQSHDDALYRFIPLLHACFICSTLSFYMCLTCMHIHTYTQKCV